MSQQVFLYWAEVEVPSAASPTVAVTAEAELRWDVQSVSAVEASLDARWNVLAAAQADATLPWDVRAPVEASTDLRWDVRSGVVADADLQWQLRVAVEASADLQWNLLTAVSADADCRWSLLTAVSADADYRWNLFAVVEQEADLQWEVLGAVAKYRPTSDITVGGWTTHTGSATNLWDVVNEAIVDDDDYMQSSANPSNDSVDLAIGGVINPQASSGHRLRYRLGADGGTVNARVQLLEGETVLETWNHTPAPGTLTTFDQSIHPSVVAMISNYGALRIRITANP